MATSFGLIAGRCPSLK